MTVSCGLSCFPDDGLHASEIVSRADEALYGAKRSGRNRVGVRYRDKRSAVRFPVKPEAAVDGQRRAMNLSRTGVLLATEAPVAPADELHVRLGDLSATARVVRVERGRQGTQLTVDDSLEPDFAAYLIQSLPQLYASFTESKTRDETD